MTDRKSAKSSPKRSSIVPIATPAGGCKLTISLEESTGALTIGEISFASVGDAMQWLKESVLQHGWVQPRHQVLASDLRIVSG